MINFFEKIRNCQKKSLFSRFVSFFCLFLLPATNYVVEYTVDRNDELISYVTFNFIFNTTPCHYHYENRHIVLSLTDNEFAKRAF